MTTINTASTSFSTSSPALGGMLRFARLVSHRRDVRSLLELDDRCLKDIGLTRGDVVGALEQSFDKDPSIILVVRSGEQRSRHRRLVVGPRPGGAVPAIRPASRFASAATGRS